jgi:hypothetical protein
MYIWEAWRRYPGRGEIFEQPEVREKMEEMCEEAKKNNEKGL